MQLKEVKALLDDSGISAFEDEDIKYVLRSSYVKGDTTRAFELLSLLAESDEGMVKPYDPNIRLVGAVNRHGVSCYLDSILFAMFARLESFEAMLYNENGDEARKRLSTLLRLWVNTLRVGQLITTDLVCSTLLYPSLTLRIVQLIIAIKDQADTRFARQMWLGGCRQSSAAGRI